MTRLLLLCPLIGLAACASQLPPAPHRGAGVRRDPRFAGTRRRSRRAHPRELRGGCRRPQRPGRHRAGRIGSPGVRRERRPLGHRRPHLRQPSAGPYYLAYFQGPARSGMEIFLRRGARFEPMIRARFQRRGPARRPGLSRADRERVLERGREPRLRRGDVAVHARHRQGLRPPGRLLGGRAPRSR